MKNLLSAARPVYEPHRIDTYRKMTILGANEIAPQEVQAICSGAGWSDCRFAWLVGVPTSLFLVLLESSSESEQLLL